MHRQRTHSVPQLDASCSPRQQLPSILAQANKEATPKAMADGVTYKQATTLDNGGYHAFQAFNPLNNRDTSAIKVQEMFR